MMSKNWLFTIGLVVVFSAVIYSAYVYGLYVAYRDAWIVEIDRDKSAIELQVHILQGLEGGELEKMKKVVAGNIEVRFAFLENAQGYLANMSYIRMLRDGLGPTYADMADSDTTVEELYRRFNKTQLGGKDKGVD